MKSQEKEVSILNSKAEFNRCLLPELTVQLGRNKAREDKEEDSNTENYFNKGWKLEDKTAQEPRLKKKKAWHEQLKGKRKTLVKNEITKRRKIENQAGILSNNEDVKPMRNTDKSPQKVKVFSALKIGSLKP